MPYDIPADVLDQIEAQIAKGAYRSADDVLRAALHALRHYDDEITAIQAGFADADAGRVRFLEDVDADICRDFGFNFVGYAPA